MPAIFSGISPYSSFLVSSKCLTMAANILFVRVTRVVFADEVVGGLDNMATSPLLPNLVTLCTVCEGHRKRDHCQRCFVSLIF